MTLPTHSAIRRQLEKLAADVFAPEIALGIASAGDISVMPEEEATLARMVPARRREFAAGRTAARRALGQSVAIPMGPDRAPVWPAGVAGSITHTQGWALAVVGKGMIGIDLEEDEPLPTEVFGTVLLPKERAALGADTRRAKLIFSAKECVYKAQYPVTKELFGFEVISITLGDTTFHAEFQRNVGPFERGHILSGRYAIGGGFILTGIA
ncbi:4'-phosphopantetheinyl transferase family protein [Pararhodobacter zhoushanensis]|uniref:Enterobactin synthase component D n=1 Tax=Pararhodobacter zhoushanensis TaxID=2479545 RepID=A0ABT3GUN7_9RHOB|nr:4'-phosphopantetheinyl transferase superfamily protein [Pararhodobacter zhoushanensis]MCW1931251.1 4'-phosphopantetheinyl transferase superfamily protein [Pararhodobacter zhoushanensis]